MTGRGRLAVVVGYAGSGKSAMLGVAREAWEGEGLTIRGAALSGIAADNLEGGSGIASRTLVSLEHQWDQGRDLLTSRDVLVIDEAGLIGSRQMERVLTKARDAGAKVVLVGDPQQLQAIEAGAAFRSIAERHGAVEITEVRRQREDWQRAATRQLATGRTAEALEAYERAGMVHAAGTREEARRDLVEGWSAARKAGPGSAIILAHTNEEVRELNDLARGRLREAGGLGADVAVQTARGERAFAVGDRVMFLRNERSLGVKNGTLGTLEQVAPDRIQARLDDGRSVAFDLKSYDQLDHGYAATIHKAQGVTVDRAHVLATPGLDRHAAYVALSRHRTRVDVHYGSEDFANRDDLVRTLSRERAKDMASDYSDFAERRGVDPATAIQPRDRAILRHAKAIADIFHAQDHGSPETTSEALHQSRRALNAFDPHASRDIERAYAKIRGLAEEAAGGRIRRAVQAMTLETELRQTAPARAQAFVDRWRDLGARDDAAYQAGDYAGRRSIRHAMGEMAKSLERDPQLESILQARRHDLGVPGSDAGRSLGRQLAFSMGLDLGRGRGLGI